LSEKVVEKRLLRGRPGSPVISSSTWPIRRTVQASADENVGVEEWVLIVPPW